MPSCRGTSPAATAVAAQAEGFPPLGKAARTATARRSWQYHVSKTHCGEGGDDRALGSVHTRGMTASARGTVDHPGTKVRRKAVLNRAIPHSGWAALNQILDYRAAEGIEVPAAHASQTCSFIDASSHRWQASFVCVACGFALNADRNILASGTGATAWRGASPTGTPETRETDRRGNCNFAVHVAAPACVCADTAERKLFQIKGLQISFRQAPGTSTWAPLLVP